MKILYGVQATGNGHITRARALAGPLRDLGVSVDYLFTGRKRKRLFDMQEFGDYQYAPGLTFHCRRGRVQMADTMLRNNLVRFTKDVRKVDVDCYDLIVSDYEPVTAWAARMADRDAIGIGHQYALNFPKVPQFKGTYIDQFVMQNFAPTERVLGLHWHHFDSPIIPPIAPINSAAYRPIPKKILVYLPFESRSAITALLKKFTDYQFSIYHPTAKNAVKGHLTWRVPSVEGFRQDMLQSEGVICNAGFELPSEALQLGLKLLVKPLDAQPEQQANAMSLSQLGYASQMHKLSSERVAQWLDERDSVRVNYPDTALAVAQWLADGAGQSVARLSQQLWQTVTVEKVQTPVVREQAEWLQSA